MGAARSSYAGIVFSERDVANVMKLVLHVPVTASVFKDSLGCAAVGELDARDTAYGFLGNQLSGEIMALSFDFKYLLRSRQVSSRGVARQNRDLTGIDSAMALVNGL